MYAVISWKLIRGSSNWGSREKPWVARLVRYVPDNEPYVFIRDFVNGAYDYSRATKSGKNVYVYFALAPGLYEFYAPVSWKHEDHYFAQVNESGDIRHKVPREEVIACLTKPISE